MCSGNQIGDCFGLTACFSFGSLSSRFPLALLGDYPKERIAVICYGAVMLFAGLSFSWMRYYAFFIGGKLTYPDIDLGPAKAGNDKERI